MRQIATKPIELKTAKEVRRCKNQKGVEFVEAFQSQLQELFFIDNKEYIGRDEREVLVGNTFLQYIQQKKLDFTHFLFPWNNHLVKTVQANDYFRLKTNRNQDLITAEEQEILYRKRVVVLGMSVGSNIAFLLTQAGISQNITIADFDSLDATNLNRIFAGVHQIGLNKTHIATRRIYEDNPFADVRVMDNGVSKENLESLLKTGEFDLIIEEIDSLPFKISSRLLAMKYKVPVLMVTDNGDGVILHIERYDLGHDKIFGKSTNYWKKIISDKLPTKKEIGDLIINDVVGGHEKVDPRMLVSVKRVINHELVSWSQLGSAAMLAGVVATIFTKRILLKENFEKDVRSHIFIPEKNLGTHSE